MRISDWSSDVCSSDLQTVVVGPAVARFGERDAATLGLLVAVAIFVGFAFVRTTWGAFLLLMPVALQSPVQPALMAMMSRRATADTQGEVQGISAMVMGLGQLVAPLLLTGTIDRKSTRLNSSH